VADKEIIQALAIMLWTDLDERHFIEFRLRQNETTVGD
jgi:hypothetical protein